MRINDNMESLFKEVETNKYKIVNGKEIFCNGRNTMHFTSNYFDRLTTELGDKVEVNKFIIKNECQKIDFEQDEIRNIQSEELIESLNRFSTEVMVKEEPHHDIGSGPVDQTFNNIEVKQEIIEPTETFFTEVTFKEVLEDLIRENDALAKVSEEDEIEPRIKLTTADQVKQGDEELDQKYLCRLEDINNKYLMVKLTRLQCYMCNHCPVFYKKKRDLLCHIHTEHYSLFQNPVAITKSLHYCGICGKNLTYKMWHTHMTIVHSMKQCKCTVCDKVFKHKIYLKRHQMYVHENVKPSWRFRNIITNDKVTCPVCSKEFNHKNSLQTHLKNCHSQKAYTCKLCKSILKCKSYLYAHMRRVHYNDGKVHSCDLCQKKFKSPRYVKIHKKNAHKL